MTASEAIRHAHLDGWNVRTEPVWTMTPDGMVQIDNRFATLADIRKSADGDERETRVFDVVGSSYAPIQNEQSFTLLDSIVSSSGAHYETAGALGDGRKTFVSLRMPEGIQIQGTDAIDLFLIATNTHDGSGSLRLMVSPTRVVCANTLALALRDHKTSWTVRHTKSADQNIGMARQSLALTFEVGKEWADLMNTLATTSMTDADFGKFMRDLYATDEDMSKRQVTANETDMAGITALWNNSATMTDLDQTAYRAYNAYTEYFDWFANVRDTTNGDRALALATRSVSDKANTDRANFVSRLLATV
jgi:phage/plasmid-like protein (TIGR03299 family)